MYSILTNLVLVVETVIEAPGTGKSGCDVAIQNGASAILAHQIRITEILSWDRKSYLTHAILPKLSREGYIHWLY